MPIDTTDKRKRGGRQSRDGTGFTDRERAFVLHYLGAANRIGCEAALMAGYARGNRQHARVYASKLMAKPHIQAEIERVTAERNTKLSITAEDVLRDLVQLRDEAKLLGSSIQTIKVRREVLKDIGEHVAVGAFRKNVGLSSPTGGPIETVDMAALAQLSDEELDQLERARAIIDRIGAARAGDPEHVGDTGGEGAPPQGE